MVAGLMLSLAACGGQASDPASNGAALASGPANAGSSESREAGHGVRLFAEGVVDLRFVVPPVAAPPPPPGLEYRGRYTYPAGGENVLDGMIFAAPIGAPNGVDPVFVISHWLTRIDRVKTSQTPDNNFLMTGHVIATPVPSPFGPLVGRLAAYTGGFAAGPNASFTLFGATVSASHTTVLPTATGSLLLPDDD
jgi:hypothetical protein